MINKFKKISLGLAVVMSVGLATPAYAKSEFYEGDILALGEDLTKAQEESVRDFLNAPDGTRTIIVTDETIIEQLGLDPNNPANYAGGCYSSAYVKLLDGNKGITVDARNLTEVTSSMLMNALITSGITSAKVKVTAPFKVTGTSALSGILAGIEDVSGVEISLKQKETAQKEIETTVEIAEEVGQEEASTIINDIKSEVIKEQPKNEKEITKIVINITKDYNIEISDKSKESLVTLMTDVNDLELNYSELKGALTQAGDTLKDKLKDLGVKLKEEGFFEKIWNFISDLWNKFLSLFEKDDTESVKEPEEAVQVENNTVCDEVILDEKVEEDLSNIDIKNDNQVDNKVNNSEEVSSEGSEDISIESTESTDNSQNTSNTTVEEGQVQENIGE